MKRTLFSLGLLVALLAIARYVTSALHISPVVTIALMLLLYFALSAAIKAVQKRDEEAEIRQLAAEDHLDAASVDRLIAAREVDITIVRRATRVGMAWVNLPILPIMFGPMILVQYGLAVESDWILALTFVLSFILAWTWWSVNISLWRRWTAGLGIEPTLLQQHAIEASLIWPAGHFFERTEMDNIRSRWRAQQSAAPDRPKRGA